MSDSISIACRECGAPMVERENRVNGSRFLGCSTWPLCTNTRSVPAFIEMKRAGAFELPGLDDL